MADLRCNVGGIRSPNPFWLASAPPTDKEYNVRRALKAGWGGIVWKTLGEDPPVVNVSSRYGGVSYHGKRLAGLNNIELISDRALAINLAELKAVKADYPDRAIVASLMVPCTEESWRAIVPLVEATGVDGFELNFGCPHGMSERNMGAAVGQVPEYVEMVTRWVKATTRMPVIVKLTPNVTDIRASGRAARRGGADAVSLINTVQSIVGVDLDAMSPLPMVDGQGTHGGYCGPAVKPIALRMLAELGRDAEMGGLPMSGMGGIESWREAAEFISLGAAGVQVCAAAMHHGFRIVEDMTVGLSNWMDSKGYGTLDDFRGRALANFVHWGDLNLAFETKARIDHETCIGCGKCHVACEDTAHQAIAIEPGRRYTVIDEECVGCNLCSLVCPVDDCITMVPQMAMEGRQTWQERMREPAE